MAKGWWVRSYDFKLAGDFDLWHAFLLTELYGKLPIRWDLQTSTQRAVKYSNM
jgi:hypothetical protein